MIARLLILPPGVLVPHQLELQVQDVCVCVGGGELSLQVAVELCVPLRAAWDLGRRRCCAIQAAHLSSPLTFCLLISVSLSSAHPVLQRAAAGFGGQLKPGSLQQACELLEDLMEAIVKPGHQLSRKVLKFLLGVFLGRVC